MASKKSKTPECHGQRMMWHGCSKDGTALYQCGQCGRLKSVGAPAPVRCGVCNSAGVTRIGVGECGPDGDERTTAWECRDCGGISDGEGW